MYLGSPLNLALSFIFQNLNFFCFSWHTIWWMCRAFTICLLTQIARLSGPPRYLGCVRKAYKTFSRDTWKKFQLKTWKMKLKTRLEYKSDYIAKNILGEKPMPSLPIFKINRSLHDLIHKKEHTITKPRTEYKLQFLFDFCGHQSKRTYRQFYKAGDMEFLNLLINFTGIIV